MSVFYGVKTLSVHLRSVFDYLSVESVLAFCKTLSDLRNIAQKANSIDWPDLNPYFAETLTQQCFYEFTWERFGDFPFYRLFDVIPYQTLQRFLDPPLTQLDSDQIFE